MQYTIKSQVNRFPISAKILEVIPVWLGTNLLNFVSFPIKTIIRLT
jgi:hypothetical protein